MIQIQWASYDEVRNWRQNILVPQGTHQNIGRAWYGRLLSPPEAARIAALWVGQNIECEFAFDRKRTRFGYSDPTRIGMFDFAGPERNIYPRLSVHLRARMEECRWPGGPYGLDLLDQKSKKPMVGFLIQPVLTISVSNYLHSMHTRYDEGRGFKPGRLTMLGAYWHVPLQPHAPRRREAPLKFGFFKPHAMIGSEPPFEGECIPRRQKIYSYVDESLSRRYSETIEFDKFDLEFSIYRDCPIVCPGTPLVPLIRTNAATACPIRGGAPTKAILFDADGYYDQVDLSDDLESKWLVDQTKEPYMLRYHSNTTLDKLARSPIAFDQPGQSHLQVGFVIGCSYTVSVKSVTRKTDVWDGPYLTQSVFIYPMEE